MPYRPMHEVVDEEDLCAIERQRRFRMVADFTVKAWATIPGVEAIGVTGGTAGKLWREMPYWRRRRGPPSLHSVDRLEMVLWLSRTDELRRLHRAFSRVLNDLDARGVPHEMAGQYLFGIVFDAASEDYLGVICTYATCPKGKPACEVPGCGAVRFLRQFADYGAADAQADKAKAAILFRRGRGFVASALDLPQTAPDEGWDENDVA
ncbi:hypothetical protein [Salinarimonas sp.]|uniref:hypothetical protein n=1 Tax=Salinarimonas sp. TaxID=2766526 RepID=UPI0032D90140